MSTDNPLPLRHLHYFLSKQHERNEKRVWMVIALTASMMTGEIVAGIVFGSMALLADGWYMFTHAGALSISALAYGYARRHADDTRFLVPQILTADYKGGTDSSAVIELLKKQGGPGMIKVMKRYLGRPSPN